ncbi:hypothetical protein F0145_14705 [Adhaeribacter rhizoryzae]|uniref:Uncharacterized protein n=1 Tax=Adhaeribacter rhizoryzae TaxID=2607907 RepID=A0A5M6DD96_9BACT|nr:hypothetical protein F0145_14705 [Adhaeribacter rhizoryzae]
MGKLLGWTVGGLVLLICLAASLVYFYQDKVIALFVAEANKHIKTKVQVRQIALSLFDKFPQVSVTLDGVQVMESVAGSQMPLASADKIFCTFSMLDILLKKYQVRELFMENGEVHVKVLPSGEINYRIFGKDTTAAPNEKFAFNLQKISLRNVLVTYNDQPLQQYDKIMAHQVQAALTVNGPEITIQGEGQAYVHTVRLRENEYFKNKEAYIKSSLRLNLDTKSIWLAPSLVQVNKASYEVAGQINYARNIYYDLIFKGRNTSVQSVVALLPEKYYRQYGQYESSGAVYFNGLVKGHLSPTESPLVNISFGCRNAAFYQPDYKQKITHLSLNGSFTNGARHKSATSVLALKNFKARLAGEPIVGNLVYRNFDNPYLELDLKGKLAIADVLGIFPVAEIKSGSGQAQVAVAFAGPLKLFRTGGGEAAVKANGDITLHNAMLQLSGYQLPFRGLYGNFLIRKNDVAVTNFRGWLGNSDFKLNGFFKNALSWLFLKNQGLRIEADLESKFINGDQLLRGGVAQTANKRQHNSAKGINNYRLRVSPRFSFDINASVRHLQFRRFRAKNIKGNVQLQRQVVSSPQISMNVAGGKFTLHGRMDAHVPDNIKITTTANLANMQVDSLFYEFENFGQQFILQQHLRGVLTANINSDLYFNSRLQAKTDLMEAEIKAMVRNGQLLNFEPLQKLSRFLKRKELENIRFAELSNNFWIQKRTVFIPEMEIRTDVTRASVIGVQGTHTFDQEMDYKFRIPLILRKVRLPEESGTPVAVTAGTPNLFLTLKGNEQDYKVAMDKSRVKNKITLNLRRAPTPESGNAEERKTPAPKEKVGLKEVLKNKRPEKRKEEVKPEEGEYFDF